MGTQIKPLKRGWCEKSKYWTALPKMRLPKEEGLSLVLPGHSPLLCRCFLKSYCLCLRIKSPPQRPVFSRGVCKLCENNSSESRWGRERARHCIHAFPPFPSLQRDFSKLSLRAELLSAGEQVTLHISMTSKWLSLLYTLISRDTNLEVSYLLFCVKTMECRSTAKSWFPFPDINHFTLTLHQK